MKNIHTRIPICVLAATLLLFQLIFLSSCTFDVNSEYAEKSTREFIGHLIEDDFDGAYQMFKDYISKDEFAQGYNQLIPYFKGIKSYELKQIGWHFKTENGTSYYFVTFKLKGDNNNEILMESGYLKDGDKFISFHVDSSNTETNTTSSNIVNTIFIVISILAVGFSLWMVVDCAKRSINKKALWIIFILLGVALSLTLGEGLSFKFNFSLALVLFRWTANLTSSTTAIRIVIPVGAIVYFIKRKSLTILPPNQTEENISSVSIGNLPRNTDTTDTEEKNKEQ